MDTRPFYTGPLLDDPAPNCDNFSLAAPRRGAARPSLHLFERARLALVFLGRASRPTMKTDWISYPSPGFHDELVGPGGGARAAGRALMRYLTEMDGGEIAVRQQAAEIAIKAMGITFTVYHEQDGSIDRAWPLDIIPRTISRKEWQKIEAGLIQRAAALNLFINDVYHDQKFIRDGLMPPSVIHTSKNFRSVARGINPPLGTWAHI